MYIQVRLLKGWKAPIWYSVLEGSDPLEIGSIVEVPLQNRKSPAVVIALHQILPLSITFIVRSILAVHATPNDEHYQGFIKKVASFYGIDPVYFYKRIRSFFKIGRTVGPPLVIEKQISSSIPILLTDEQKVAIDGIFPALTNGFFEPVLLYGVTGSGKTVVYKELICKVLKEQKVVLYLLPEVSLCLQFQSLLARELPDFLVLGFSSASSLSEKKQVWQSLLEGKSFILVGVHLPILLPISNLGLIIVDEEHEGGFQEKKHPKINSKEIALWRAKEYNIPIILGSATPSVQSLYRAKTLGWKFFELKKRFAGAFPQIIVAHLRENKSKRKNFWVTKELEERIREQLIKKEQTIIFLNRRGYSFFLQCKGCGFTPSCGQCSVSLTYHKELSGNEELRCHYCAFWREMPLVCPECFLSAEHFLKKGIGTQQMVLILQELFPTAVIGRMDADITAQKKLLKQMLIEFEKGAIDILVGTQSITKGYHFPNVTLVGVIWADLQCNLPVFNAHEGAIQQLIQVAGRAGRAEKPGVVVVQTMGDHPLFKYLDETKYLDFYHEEIEMRKLSNYPPFTRFLQLELMHEDSEILEQEAQEVFDYLFELNEKQKLEVMLLGPVKPIVYKISKMEMRHIFLKTTSFEKAFILFFALQTKKIKSKLFLVPTQS